MFIDIIEFFLSEADNLENNKYYSTIVSDNWTY